MENSHIVTDTSVYPFCFVIKLKITEFCSRFVLSFHSNFPFFLLVLLIAKVTCEEKEQDGRRHERTQLSAAYRNLSTYFAMVCHFVIFFPSWSLFFLSFHFPALMHGNERERERERDTSLHTSCNGKCFVFFSVFFFLVCPSFISTCSYIVTVTFLRQTHSQTQGGILRTYKRSTNPTSYVIFMLFGALLCVVLLLSPFLYTFSAWSYAYVFSFEKSQFE